MSYALTPQHEALWSLQAVRDRCAQVLALANNDALCAYRYRSEKLDEVVEFVIKVTRKNYPSGKIPPHSRWRHFEVLGVDRWVELRLPDDRAECTRIATELTITSVLLDAGAGADWRYHEEGSAEPLARSEGLGVASFHLYASGGLSSKPERALMADAAGLTNLNKARFSQAFQIGPVNPLIGVDERVALLNRLGETVANDTRHFADARLGNLVDVLCQNNCIEIESAFTTLLAVLMAVWPDRGDPERLGDVWSCSGVEGANGTANRVPFHKLTQWMCYSLIEAWRRNGIEVRGEEALTALPEYRNGGLLLDFGVLEPRDPAFAETVHDPADPAVVEMRAMTVAVMDIIAERIRDRLNEPDLPLAQILEGGTWNAGRTIAKKKRPDGSPPIQYSADGTLF